MNETISGPYTREQLRRMKGETDWERLRREEAEGPYAGPFDPEIDGIEWGEARLVIPQPKKLTSVRLDRDVLDFFKAGGKGYQTRINAVLRAWMEAQKAKAG